MFYQDIPFLIVSKDVATGERIATILGRKSNTRIECYDPEVIYNFHEKINYFTCNVFHYSGPDPILEEIIINLLRKRPVSPIFLISNEKPDIELYQKFIQMGITDILVYNVNVKKEEVFNALIQSLNQRWKIFRYLERERKKIYHATVVTAYHELNQPLTVIMNALDLFKIEIKTGQLSEEKIKKNLGFIFKSVQKIQEILEKMKKVEQPTLKAYTKTVPMISLNPEPESVSQNLDLLQEMRVNRDPAK